MYCTEDTVVETRDYMGEKIRPDVSRQYRSADPLMVRMQTHRIYGERQVDLDEICYTALDLQGNETILDAGCGPGHFLDHIRECGHAGQLIGLDQSAAMVMEVVGLGIDAVEGDVQQLPYDEASLDRVVARHMLYHVPDIGRALAEMRRVLKPDGALLVTTNSDRSMPIITSLIQDMLAAFEFPEWERPDARFCIENSAEFFADSGFDVKERVIENALVFHEPGPPAAYCVSSLPSLNIPQEPALYAEIERWLLAEANRKLAALDGVWRDPTYAGVYVGAVSSA